MIWYGMWTKDAYVGHDRIPTELLEPPDILAEVYRHDIEATEVQNQHPATDVINDVIKIVSMINANWFNFFSLMCLVAIPAIPVAILASPGLLAAALYEGIFEGILGLFFSGQLYAFFSALQQGVGERLTEELFERGPLATVFRIAFNWAQLVYGLNILMQYGAWPPGHAEYMIIARGRKLGVKRQAPPISCQRLVDAILTWYRRHFTGLTFGKAPVTDIGNDILQLASPAHFYLADPLIRLYAKSVLENLYLADKSKTNDLLALETALRTILKHVTKYSENYFLRAFLTCCGGPHVAPNVSTACATTLATDKLLTYLFNESYLRTRNLVREFGFFNYYGAYAIAFTNQIQTSYYTASRDYPYFTAQNPFTLRPIYIFCPTAPIRVKHVDTQPCTDYCGAQVSAEVYYWDKYRWVKVHEETLASVTCCAGGNAVWSFSSPCICNTPVDYTHVAYISPTSHLVPVNEFITKTACEGLISGTCQHYVLPQEPSTVLCTGKIGPGPEAFQAKIDAYIDDWTYSHIFELELVLRVCKISVDIPYGGEHQTIDVWLVLLPCDAELQGHIGDWTYYGILYSKCKTRIEIDCDLIKRLLERTNKLKGYIVCVHADTFLQGLQEAQSAIQDIVGPFTQYFANLTKDCHDFKIRIKAAQGLPLGWWDSYYLNIFGVPAYYAGSNTDIIEKLRGDLINKIIKPLNELTRDIYLRTLAIGIAAFLAPLLAFVGNFNNPYLWILRWIWPNETTWRPYDLATKLFTPTIADYLTWISTAGLLTGMPKRLLFSLECSYYSIPSPTAPFALATGVPKVITHILDPYASLPGITLADFILSLLTAASKHTGDLTGTPGDILLYLQGVLSDICTIAMRLYGYIAPPFITGYPKGLWTKAYRAITNAILYYITYIHDHAIDRIAKTLCDAGLSTDAWPLHDEKRHRVTWHTAITNTAIQLAAYYYITINNMLATFTKYVTDLFNVYEAYGFAERPPFDVHIRNLYDLVALGTEQFVEDYWRDRAPAYAQMLTWQMQLAKEWAHDFSHLVQPG